MPRRNSTPSSGNKSLALHRSLFCRYGVKYFGLVPRHDSETDTEHCSGIDKPEFAGHVASKVAISHLKNYAAQKTQCSYSQRFPRHRSQR